MLTNLNQARDAIDGSGFGLRRYLDDQHIAIARNALRGAVIEDPVGLGEEIGGRDSGGLRERNGETQRLTGQLECRFVAQRTRQMRTIAVKLRGIGYLA